MPKRSRAEAEAAEAGAAAAASAESSAASAESSAAEAGAAGAAAAPLVVDDRFDDKVRTQITNRKAFLTAARAAVAAIPTTRTVAREDARRAQVVRTVESDPILQGEAARPVREAVLAWIKTADLFVTTDGRAAVVGERAAFHGLPGLFGLYKGGFVVEHHRAKEGLKRYKRRDPNAAALTTLPFPSTEATATALLGPKLPGSKVWSKDLIAIAAAADENRTQKAITTRIAYGGIPAGTKVEVRRAEPSTPKAFVPVVFDLENNRVITADWNSGHDRWEVAIPARLAASGKQNKMHAAAAMAHVAFRGTLPTKGTGLEADHIDGDQTNDRIYNLRLVTKKANNENCGVFEVMTKHKGTDVILTATSVQDARPTRLAFLSVKHAADELGVDQSSLHAAKTKADGWWITIKRPARHAGWRITKVEADPLGIAYAALSAKNEAAGREVVAHAAAA